jgi:putative peptide zinc metalloprotease protein
MDDVPMIFDPVTGHYHRISSAAELIIGRLDGSRSSEQIVADLCMGDEAHFDRLRRQLEPFLDSLRSSGLLEGSEVPNGASAGQRFKTSAMMPRFVLSRSLPTLLEPMARQLRRWPAGAIASLVALCAVVGFVTGGIVLSQHGLPSTRISLAAYLTAAIAQMLLIVVHECAHALVAQYLETPVRGFGVALLFYVLPVAYVDRTDAYRVRQRSSRVSLALAGLVSDGLMCGLTALVVLRGSGFTQETAVALLGLQLLGLVVNCNPLLPSDGYSAIEAGTGLIDPRGRGLTVLRRFVTRKSLPAHLSKMPFWSLASYAAYGLACIGYIGVLAVGILLTLSHLVLSIGRAVG